MTNIQERPTSARILDLLDRSEAVTKMAESQPFTPFFAADILNHSILLKHRLRADEQSLFGGERTVGTKIFVPFNRARLSEGGKYIFVDQRGAEAVYHEHFGIGPDTNEVAAARDIRLLRLIDNLPSLDPFILREKLRSEGFYPHEGYFDLKEAEYKRIRHFVLNEFTPLVELAFGEESKLTHKIDRLVDVIWESRDLKLIEPLLDGLKIDPLEAPDVLFAWKGFIYYKSHVALIRQSFGSFRNLVNQMKIPYFPNNDVEETFHNQRKATLNALNMEFLDIQKILGEYEIAYRNHFIRKRQPQVFKEFLARSPQLFNRLGASVAAIKHAVSYWNFRFPVSEAMSCDYVEFVDILRDFQQGISPEFLSEESAESLAAMHAAAQSQNAQAGAAGAH